jgi:hypothetical protein
MARSLEILSRWHQSVEDLSTSTLAFYDSIEKAIRAKELPVTTERMSRHEGSVLSATREYLQLEYDRHVFLITAFPFGKNFFFGWQLGRKLPSLLAVGCLVAVGIPVLLALCIAWMGLLKGVASFILLLGLLLFFIGPSFFREASDFREALSALPIIGPMCQKLFNGDAYYRDSSRVVFEESIHWIVLDVLAGVRSIAKLSPLTDAEKAIHRMDER